MKTNPSIIPNQWLKSRNSGIKLQGSRHGVPFVSLQDCMTRWSDVRCPRLHNMVFRFVCYIQRSQKVDFSHTNVICQIDAGLPCSRICSGMGFGAWVQRPIQRQSMDLHGFPNVPTMEDFRTPRNPRVFHPRIGGTACKMC